jgi:hypothetical protein
MATPFVAACYALVKSQNPGLSVREVISLLQSTSTPMQYVYDHSILSTVAGQGAGIVNPYRAIKYQTTITLSQLEIGDADKFLNVLQTIKINNASPNTKTYTIKQKKQAMLNKFHIQTPLHLDTPISGAYPNTLSMAPLLFPLRPLPSPPVNFMKSQSP